MERHQAHPAMEVSRTGTARARLITARLIFLVALVAAGLATFASPAFAECVDQQNNFPPFRGVAPTAKQIFIGTVVGIDGPAPWSSTFQLHVTEVLRGPAKSEDELMGVQSGLPLTGPHACRADAVAKVAIGDVIALALDGRLPEYPGRVVTSVAWIEGRPRGISARGERLSVQQVRRAAHPPDTSTATIPSTAFEVSPELLGLTVVGLCAGIGLARRMRRSSRVSSCC